jgi:hypothetical protein
METKSIVKTTMLRVEGLEETPCTIVHCSESPINWGIVLIDGGVAPLFAQPGNPWMMEDEERIYVIARPELVK